MLFLLRWVPILSSGWLGAVFVVTSEAGAGVKASVCVVFLIAAFLQFFSPYPLVGLVLQAVLALCLAVWWKVETTT
jgi:hypothetical protein